MSEAANVIRKDRRGWARPGSSQDRLVGLLRVVLPVGIGVLAAFLVMAPLTMGSDTSFVLDKHKVDLAPERLKMLDASYRGTDDKGQPFVVSAASAIQKSSAEPVVQLTGLSARINLADGPTTLIAQRGHYDLNAQKVAADGPVALRSANGYTLNTSDVTFDMKSRSLESSGAAAGDLPLGKFSADRMSADLDNHNVHLDGNVRLRIQPNAPNRR